MALFCYFHSEKQYFHTKWIFVAFLDIFLLFFEFFPASNPEKKIPKIPEVQSRKRSGSAFGISPIPTFSGIRDWQPWHPLSDDHYQNLNISPLHIRRNLASVCYGSKLCHELVPRALHPFCHVPLTARPVMFPRVQIPGVSVPSNFLIVHRWYTQPCCSRDCQHDSRCCQMKCVPV